MNKTLNLSYNKILNKEFSPNRKGYSSHEVDEFLDLILQDYTIFENIIKDYDSLKKDAKKLKEENKRLEIENAMLKKRFEGIKEFDNKANYDNLELYKRISKLEKALYVAGVDPTKVK